MKIQKIFIRNLNSLAGEHTINFNERPLSDASLFAITGPTGAGKSTILDAICLALYNTYPRNDKKGITQTTMSQTGALISKGASDCFIRVEYSQNDQLYRSQWSVRFNKKNNLNNREQALFIFNKNTQIWDILESDNKVPEKNTEITSLDFVQFTRSILLAQGEFSALLTAKKDDRYAIMEKITGADIYRKIGKKVFEKYTFLKTAIENEMLKVSSVKLLSEEEIQQYIFEQSEINAKLIDWKREKETMGRIKKVKEDIENDKLLAQQIMDKLSEWEKDDIAFFADKEKLKRYQSFHHLINHWDNIKKIENDLIDIQDDLLSDKNLLDTENFNINQKLEIWSQRLNMPLTREQFIQTLQSILTQIHQAKEAKKKAFENLEIANSEKKNAEKDLENAIIEKNDLVQIIELNNKEYQNLTSDIINFESEKPFFEFLPKWKLLFEKLKQNTFKLYDELDFNISVPFSDVVQSIDIELKNIDDSIHKILEKGDRQSIDQTITENSLLLNTLKNALDGLKGQQELSLQYDEIEKQNQMYDLEIPLLKSSIEDLKKAISEHEIALEDIEKILALAAQEENLSLLRDNLVDGEPCPLCGSVHHPGIEKKAVETLSTKKQLLKKAVDLLREEKDNLSSKYSAIEINYERNEQEKNKIKKNRTDFLNGTLWINLKNEYPENDINIHFLEDQVVAIQKMITQLSDIQNEFNRLDALKDKRSVTIQKSNRLKQIEEEKDALIEEIRKSVSISQYSEIKPILTNLSEKKDKFDLLEESIKACKSTLENNEVRLENAKKNETSFFETLQSRISKVEEASKNYLDRDAQCQKLPDIENPLEDLSETSVMQDMLSKSKILYDSIEKLTLKFENLTLENQEKKASLVLETEKAGLKNVEDLEKINLTLEERKQFSEKQDDLLRRQSSLLSNKNAVENRLASFSKEDQPDITLEDINLALNTLETIIEENQNAKGKIAQKLDTDSQVRRMYEDQLTLIEEKKMELKPFELLNRMIGDGTGKKFNEYAQELTLKQLLKSTNDNLALINSRYLLDMHLEGEDENYLYVIDQFMGNNRRAVNSTLSGGETFLISLSMALGLSDLAAGKAELGNLFIDEGFGSLDPETLENALSMLEELQYKRGRQIGIISHVTELKERITTQIKVIPTLGGNSKIECV